MRSLDQFYRYVEQRGNGAETANTAEAETGNRGEADRVKEGVGRLRYVIRNGVTIPIPVEGGDSATKSASVAYPKLLPPEETEVALDSEPGEEPVAAVLAADAEDANRWRALPRSLQVLGRLAQETVDLPADPRDERRQLIDRLLNPMLSLEDTARLLGVCPATVRRWANKGTLPHQRTVGQQRRFHLADVLACLERSERKTAEGK